MTEHPSLQPATERIALEERLEDLRAKVVPAIADLTDEQARSRPLPGTAMSVADIVLHLAWCELRWFAGKLVGETDVPDSDRAWGTTAPVQEIVAEYESACVRSRAAAARFDSLDALAAQVSFGKEPVNLRWLLVHMSDETAWHLGHLDLLRDALR
jgi:hypothetical protein